MKTFENSIIPVGDMAVHVAQAHGGDGAPVIFLHGGSPGVTPYCAGMHIWGDTLDDFARLSRVVVPDLPGAGGTALPSGRAPSLELWGECVLGLMEYLGLCGFHVVGHAESGMLALWLADKAPDRLKSISIVASPSAAPSGDSLPVMTLDHPPKPLWSRLSQRWTFDQVSWSHAHIDEVLLDGCMAAAEGLVHRAVLEAVGMSGAFRSSMGASVGKTKSRFFQIYRERGISVPAQLVWGSDDPLSGVDRGFALFQLIAAKQPTAAFDVINRTGHFPFREDPQAFFDIVSGFQEAVVEKAKRSADAA